MAWVVPPRWTLLRPWHKTPAMLARSPARTLLVAALLALPLGTAGCNKKQQLTEVEVPEAGLTLRYDLTPGQTINGHVRMRTAAQTPVGEIISIVECDAEVTVLSKGDASKREVEATISNIEVSTRLPEGIPKEAAGMSPETAKALEGMQLAFDLDTHGDTSNEPEPPEGTDPQTAGLLSLITSGVTAGISVRLPEETIEDGATWDAAPAELDEGVKSASSKGTFEGLGRNEAGEDIAKLSYVSSSEATRQQGGMSLEIKTEATTKATFSASGGYPVSVERKINQEVVGKATILIEIEAGWSKGDAVAVDGEEQAITDPCDPDYVGAEECSDEAAPAE